MEGMSNYWLVWLIYIGFGIVGVWCWDKLFFWLKKGGDMRRLAMVLGAVLLLTPAPIPETEGLFAPAIYILILDLLSGSSPLGSPALVWILVVRCIAAVALTIDQLILKKKQAD